jgi:tetratricopeptide (TPR) repeat protein
VLAHVAEAHGAEVATLLDWIERTLGLPLSLAMLVGDPRRTTRTGLEKLQWGVHHVLATLLGGEGDREQLRVSAATDLMVADEYDKALAVLDAVLESDPSRVDARALRADVLQCAGRDAEALALAEEVLRSAPLEPRAISVMMHGLVKAQRWEDLLDVSTSALEAPGLKRFEQRTRSLARARALLELRRWSEMDATVDALLSTETSRFFRARASGLRALSLLRRGDARAALDTAERELIVPREHTWWHYVFDAVRFEALHVLARSGECRPLPPGARKALTGMRFDQWVRQLEELGAWDSTASVPTASSRARG